MLTFPSTVRVYLAPGPTDLRKSFDTLAAVAREVLEPDPLPGHLFAFCGRRRNLVKILVWDGTGFWLLAKRLARGTFAWPAVPADGARRLDLRPDHLAALLSGVDLDRGGWRPWWRKDPAGLEAS